MRSICCMFCCALAVTISGCLYIPTPPHDLLAGRGMIEPEATQDLKVDITTKEDILLRFGEPDATLNNQTVFLYTWTRAQGYVIPAIPGGNVHPFGLPSMLMLEFNKNNYLKRFEYISAGFSSVMDRAQRWASKDVPIEILPGER